MFLRERTKRPVQPPSAGLPRWLWILLVVHWAVIVAAVPVFTFLIRDNEAQGHFFIAGFLSMIALMLATPVRRIINTQGDRPFVCPKARHVWSVACVATAVMMILTVVGLFLLRKGGPHVEDGVYLLWDHGPIREITQKEYLRLCTIERLSFCSALAAVRSCMMVICCRADDIR